ncbi:proton-coupled folate transporter-like [Glandiceps talaboti]
MPVTKCKRLEKAVSSNSYISVANDVDSIHVPAVDTSTDQCTPLSRLRQTVTVEPVIFFALLVVTIISTVRVQFVTHSVSVSFNYSGPGQGQANGSAYGDCTVNKSDPNYILGQKVQASSSYWLLSLDLVSSILSLFSTSFIGSFSENGGGRKIPMLISTTGYVLYVVSILLVVTLELPLEYFFISEVIRGLTGNYFATVAISYAVIADITTKEQRTARLVILEVFAFLAGCTSQVGVGYWLREHGFASPIWFASAISAFLVLFISIWVKETRLRQLYDIKSVFRNQYKEIIRLFSSKYGDEFYQLVILCLALLMTALVYTSLPTLLLLYVIAPPFCLDSVFIGYFLAVIYVSNALGLLIGGKLLSFCMGDVSIAMLSFLSYIASLMTTAFAQSPTLILIAQAVGGLGSLNAPMIKSRISKLVGENEQGVAFSFVEAMQGIAQCISPIVFNTIYAATVDFMPNLVFFCYIFCYVVVLALICSIKIRECRKKNRFVPLDDNVDKEEDEDHYPVLARDDPLIGE